MRHFAALSPDQAQRLFLHPPQPVDLAGPRDQLAVALGATLYCPATRQRLADDLQRLAGRGVLSAVACLEDSVPDDQVAEAEASLVRGLADLATRPQWRTDPPLMLFLRARTPEQLLRVVERSGAGARCLLGFVLIRKFVPETKGKSLEAIQGLWRHAPGAQPSEKVG